MRRSIRPVASWTRNRTQQGISVVEIMVALTVGLLLAIGVGQIYLGSRQSYRMQDSHGRLQESARFALEMLSRDIREAGYRSCNRRVPVANSLNSASAYLYDFANGIRGNEWTAGASSSTAAASWTPPLDPSVTSPAAGSDVITVRGPVGQGSDLTVAMAGATSDVTVAANTIAQCDIVMVGDCRQATFFQATSVSGSPTIAHATGTCTADGAAVPPGNATTDLHNRYGIGALAIPVATTSYYVRTNSQGQPALYRRVGSAPAVELVEGIENLQFLYGVDRLPAGGAIGDYVPDQYMSADDVAAADIWNRVVTVRLSFVARTSGSIDSATNAEIGARLTPETLTYKFDRDGDGIPESITTSDGRLRRVFTSTIGLRNRLR